MPGRRWERPWWGARGVSVLEAPGRGRGGQLSPGCRLAERRGRRAAGRAKGRLLRGHGGVSGVLKRSAETQAEAGTGV